MPQRDVKQTDIGFKLIVALVAVVTVWLLLTPFIPSVASTSLHRFHLRSSSFAWWSLQQPIPTMYNFANRHQVSEIPPGFIDPILDDLGVGPEKRYINHFPVRVVTWASGRALHLRDGKDRWVTVESSYRGLTLKSRFHAKPSGGGGYELIRLPDQEPRR